MMINEHLSALRQKAEVERQLAAIKRRYRRRNLTYLLGKMALAVLITLAVLGAVRWTVWALHRPPAQTPPTVVRKWFEPGEDLYVVVDSVDGEGGRRIRYCPCPEQTQ